MNPPSFRWIPVQQLYIMLAEGRFAVPKLQRTFVWNGRKAADLLDSLYRGMPIGAITLWDTSKRNKNLLRHALHILPPFQDYNRRIWFILDGQQRLSVLHHVTTGDAKFNASHRIVDFSRVVFRVTDGQEEPRFQYRKPVPGK